MGLLSTIFGVKITSAPLTKKEAIWRTLTIGSDIEYMGKKGKVVYNRDMREANEESDEHWDGPAYVVMRYINDIGSFQDIKLYPKDLF